MKYPMAHLPSRISWPLAIVTLLVANICIAVGTLILANTNGGVQVVPDYYAQAVAWDSLAAVQQSTTAMNWSVEVKANRQGKTTTVTVTDNDGLPVSGLVVSAIVSRPHLSEPTAVFALVADEIPGKYISTESEFDSAGIYDFKIAATRDVDMFSRTFRVDVP